MSEEKLAKKILEVIPTLIRFLRGEITIVGGDTITMPQFRILANIHRGMKHVGEIAYHHGVSQPAMSNMVDTLVKRGLIKRVVFEQDRRHVELSLTNRGEEQFEVVRRAVQVRVQERLKRLNSKEKDTLLDALSSIEALFSDIPNGIGKYSKKRGQPEARL